MCLAACSVGLVPYCLRPSLRSGDLSIERPVEVESLVRPTRASMYTCMRVCMLPQTYVLSPYKK